MKIIHTSSKSKKSKPNAEQRRLAAEWEKLKSKHDKPLEKGLHGKKSKVLAPKKLMPMDVPAGRVTGMHPSLVTPGGEAAKKESQQYTGSAMLGLGQMHKSNAVPVFRQEDAIDIAKMRRG